MDLNVIDTDPEEQKVLAALAQDDSTWRTLSAVARQAGLSENRVREILAKYPHLACYSLMPSLSGSALVGLVERVG